MSASFVLSLVGGIQPFLTADSPRTPPPTPTPFSVAAWWGCEGREGRAWRARAGERWATRPRPRQGCAGAERPFTCRISPTGTSDQVAQGTHVGLPGARSVRAPRRLGRRSGPHRRAHVWGLRLASSQLADFCKLYLESVAHTKGKPLLPAPPAVTGSISRLVISFTVISEVLSRR